MEMIFWGALFVAFVIAEIATVAYVSVWFAVASLVSFVLALCDVSLKIQFIVFVVTSLAVFLITRPLVKKLSKGKIVPTNADALIGKEGIVRIEVDNLKSQGRVYVNGLEWAARSSDGSIIETDEKVLICSIEGASLIVKKA